MLNSLFSKSKQKILRVAFLNPDRQFYLRELNRMTGVSQGTLHRELKSLIRDGILLSEKRGHQVFYTVNKGNPIYAELKGIVLKTFGVADALKAALKQYQRKVRAGFIYGSIARGDDSTRSDIDVMLIGDITLMEITNTIDAVEMALGRTVNPTVFPVQEFRKKALANNHFVNTVLNSPLTFFVGNRDELRDLVGK